MRYKFSWHPHEVRRYSVDLFRGRADDPVKLIYKALFHWLVHHTASQNNKDINTDNRARENKNREEKKANLTDEKLKLKDMSLNFVDQEQK